MPAPFAAEFSSDLSQDVLSSELNPIEEQERTQVGAARARGASGGIGAQASTGAEVGALESGAAKNENATISNFNLDVAGKRYSERMTDQNQAFQDAEQQKQDAFSQSMAAMGYQQRQAEQAGANHAAEKGQLIGLAGTIGGAAIGSFGGPAGAAVGAQIGGKLAGSFSSQMSGNGDEIDPESGESMNTMSELSNSPSWNG